MERIRTDLICEYPSRSVSSVYHFPIPLQQNEKPDKLQAYPASSAVRKAGLEPARHDGRHPLKMVRLPIPPLPHLRDDKYTVPAVRSTTGEIERL